MIRVYLCGPYSDDPICRVLDAAKVQHNLMDLGFSVFCPHTAYHWANEIRERSYEDWMTQCLEEVRRSDVVLRMPGESKGADREVSLAMILNIPVVHSEASLCAWRDEQKKGRVA